MGEGPQGNLIMDNSGNLYGTTPEGGNGYGTVFEVAPDGTETILHTFTGRKRWRDPSGGIIMDSSGDLYGVTLKAE